MRYVWLIIGTTALIAGLAGVVLPLVPATVLFVVAAWAFGKSSPRLQAWILTNPYIGPPVVDWRDHGIIRRKAKVGGIAGILLSVAVAVYLKIPPVFLAVQAVSLAGVAVFIWTRPENS